MAEVDEPMSTEPLEDRIREGWKPEGIQKLVLLRDNLDYFGEFANPIKKTGNLNDYQKGRLNYYDSLIATLN